jgi:hypothetical protein
MWISFRGRHCTPGSEGSPIPVRRPHYGQWTKTSHPVNSTKGSTDN